LKYRRRIPKLETPKFQVGEQVYICNQFEIAGPYRIDGIEYDSCGGYCEPHLFYIIKEASHTHHSEDYIFRTRLAAEAALDEWAASRKRREQSNFPCLECGDRSTKTKSVILQYVWERKQHYRFGRHKRLCGVCATDEQTYKKWLEVYPPEMKGSALDGAVRWKKH
jgi:hypothetical protein